MRRLLPLTLLAVTLPLSASDSMQQLFDRIGAYGNTTAPGAYHAQGVNVLAGGSLFFRVPQQSLHPAQLQLPSLRMGCGGIDLHAGSFSFIGKDALVSLMKNIGSSAAAFAFKLGLDVINPQINKTMTELQQVAQDLNATNISSCEAGEALARGMAGDWQRSAQYFARVAGPLTGRFSDHSEARAATQGNNAQVNATLAAVSDPQLAGYLKPGNLAWRALHQLPGLDNEDRQLLMSLSGTLVLPVQRPADEAPRYYPPKPLGLQQFIHGDDDGKVAVYRCADSEAADGCLQLADEQLTLTPFARKVEQKLAAIASHFRNNTRLTQDDIAFVNTSSVPVYRALAVASALPAAGLDRVWIARYADLIAADYAYQYIALSTQQLRQAYVQSAGAQPAIAQDGLRRLLASSERLQVNAREELRGAWSKAESVNRIAEEILAMERSLLASLPAHLAGNLRFAAGGR